MAREIIIHNGQLFKHSLSIEDIIGSENYGYGISDDHFRLDIGKTSGGPLIIFDNDNIGRGIQIIDLSSKKKLHLALAIPATENDVKMLYKLASRIASLWKTKYIFVEEDKVALQNIDIYIQHDIDVSEKLLKDANEVFGHEEILFPCATIPITFSIAQLQDFASNPEGFGTFLHEKQEIGAYFSAPLFHHVNDMFHVLYVVFDGGHIILPNTPQMSFRSEGKEVSCNQSFVVCSNLFPGEKLSKISFPDFLDRVPAEKKSKFDVVHTLINPMSIEELQSIFCLE